jgi:capsid protein
MKQNRRARRRVELFEASLASGTSQALAGWAAEYTHTLLESDPELRQELRRNWLRMFGRIAQLTRNGEKTPRRRAGRQRRA